MKRKENIWIITAKSESGDDYGPKRYDYEPTDEDKHRFITEETSESLDEEGPGDFGSYIYLTVNKL